MTTVAMAAVILVTSTRYVAAYITARRPPACDIRAPGPINFTLHLDTLCTQVGKTSLAIPPVESLSKPAGLTRMRLSKNRIKRIQTPNKGLIHLSLPACRYLVMHSTSPQTGPRRTVRRETLCSRT
ncbi:hypothetical protein GGR52DRAFT_93179 [Hypoxylon sp. FL1284]|nr:hypothetical protein GGR52DRAFT_93179 [Hypoxylon sp. FL1284]